MAKKQSNDGAKIPQTGNLFDFETGEQISPSEIKRPEDESIKKGVAVQTIVFDADTGEVLRDQTRLSRSDNGKDWDIMYQSTLRALATDKTLTRADIATYLFIAGNVDYDCKFMTTKRDMAERLRISYPQMLSSIDKLKQYDYIREGCVNGTPTFYLNPDYTTRGKERRKLAKAYEGIPREELKAAIQEVLESF